MIGRARELLAELVDVARAARALPHVIETQRDLRLSVIALEERSESQRADVRAIATAYGDIAAVVSELYTGPCRADAEVPDA